MSAIRVVHVLRAPHMTPAPLALTVVPARQELRLMSPVHLFSIMRRIHPHAYETAECQHDSVAMISIRYMGDAEAIVGAGQ